MLFPYKALQVDCFSLQGFPNVRKHCLAYFQQFFCGFAAEDQHFNPAQVTAVRSLNPQLFHSGGSQDVEVRFNNTSGQVTVVGLRAAVERKMNEIKSHV